MSLQRSSSIDKTDGYVEDLHLDQITPSLSTGIPLSHFADFAKMSVIKRFWRLYLTALSVNLAAVYTGYALSIPGSIIANPGFIGVFGTVRDPVTGLLVLDATHVALWNGIPYVTQVLSQLCSTVTADRFGVKFNMYLLTLFLTLSIVLEIVAKNWVVYLVAKMLAGLATGFIGTSVLTYISEVAMPQMRGSLLAGFSLFYAIGQLLASVCLQILEQTTPLQFRRAFYSEFAILGVWLIPLLWIPESPIYYLKKGKVAQAEKALRRLVGNVQGYDIKHELSVLQAELDDSKALAEAQAATEWGALLKPINLKRCIISTIPFTFQNVVGVPLVFGYTAYFFQLAGLPNVFQAVVIIYAILIFGVVTSFWGVERVGRRPLVLYGGLFMAIIDIAIGGLGTKTVNGGALGNALVALCCIWVYIYAVTLAPIGWISIVEISSPVLRAKTAGIAAMLQSFSGILFNYTVPLMLSNQKANWGPKIGFFFGALSFVFLIPVWFLFPETKGRTYSELDELFQRRIPARHFATTETAASQAKEQRTAAQTSSA